MYQFEIILCFIVALGAFCASEKTLPLDQLKGPWTIRNASENAIPIIGKCASMEIEPSPKEAGEDGIIQLKTSVQTFTLTVVNVNHKIYQIFYPHDARSSPLGNVSILHAEKSTFFISELQTEGQIYLAVFTKGNETSPGTHKKIEKLWKALKKTKHTSLEPVENDNCTETRQEETSSNSSEEPTTPLDNQSGETSDVSALETKTKKSTGEVEEKIKEKPDSDKPETSTTEDRISSSTNEMKNDLSSTIRTVTPILVSTHYPTGRSSGKHEALAIVDANGTKATKMEKSSGSTISSSYFILIITCLLCFIRLNDAFMYV